MARPGRSGRAAARRAADAGPLTLVPCDNLPDNGAALAGRAAASWPTPSTPRWPDWIDRQVSRRDHDGRPDHPAAHRRRPRAPSWPRTGVDDAQPGGHRAVQRVGARRRLPRRAGRPGRPPAPFVTDDVTPFEQRKLLAAQRRRTRCWPTPARCAGTPPSPRRSPTESAARWLEQWWDACAPHLDLPAAEAAAYRAALLERFANPRIRHALAQIAADGSQKLPVRLAAGAARRARRRPAARRRRSRVLAAWLLHLRGAGVPVRDVRGDELRAAGRAAACRRRPRRPRRARTRSSADDAELVAAVRGRCADLSRRR